MKAQHPAYEKKLKAFFSAALEVIGSNFLLLRITW